MTAGSPRTAVTRIAVLHGPNLNLLGEREPAVYGRTTLREIDERLLVVAAELGVELTTAQFNGEGAMIDAIHTWRGGAVQGALVNAGAYTHTSLALRDALSGVAVPFVEVHLSNIHAREPFRRHSYFSDLAVGMICGLGSRGYDLALQYALQG